MKNITESHAGLHWQGCINLKSLPDSEGRKAPQRVHSATFAHACMIWCMLREVLHVGTEQYSHLSAHGAVLLEWFCWRLPSAETRYLRVKKLFSCKSVHETRHTAISSAWTQIFLRACNARVPGARREAQQTQARSRVHELRQTDFFRHTRRARALTPSPSPPAAFASAFSCFNLRRLSILAEYG
jgi:hypothetical protein